MGRLPPVLTVREFSTLATCYAESNGRFRPIAVVSEGLSEEQHNHENT
jgi:hypothetical protein